MTRAIVPVYLRSPDQIVSPSPKVAVEEALDAIDAASTGSLGEVCVNAAGFKSLPVGVEMDPRRYDATRQKIDMTAMVLQNLGADEATRRNGESFTSFSAILPADGVRVIRGRSARADRNLRYFRGTAAPVAPSSRRASAATRARLYRRGVEKR